MRAIIVLSAVSLTAGLLVVGCSESSSGKSTGVAGWRSTAAPVASAAPAATPITPHAPTWVPAGTNVPVGPLFDLPPDYIANGGDPVFTPTRYESDSFTDRNPSQVPQTLKLVCWNIEKGVDTLQVENELQSLPELMDADFIFLQECPRYDDKSVPAHVNFARDLAQRLRMDYVFSTQWDFRYQRTNGGENGCAILSKYPLGNVELLRSQPSVNYWRLFKRLGAPLTLAVDAKVGDRFVRLYNTHLMVFDGGGGRERQAREILVDTRQPDRSPLQILAGDLNTWTCNPLIGPCGPGQGEPAVDVILNDGWQNGLPGIPTHTQLGAGFLPQLLDWIFWRSLPSVTPGGVVTAAHGADHLPLYFEFSVR